MTLACQQCTPSSSSCDWLTGGMGPRCNAGGFARNIREEKSFSAGVSWKERPGPQHGESLPETEASTEERPSP